MGTFKMKNGGTFGSFTSSTQSSTQSSGNQSQKQIQAKIIEENLHYRNQGQLSIGEINRFVVHYYANEDRGNVLEDDLGKYIWLRVRNVEMQFFRPIYFTGPFSFYIDVTPYNFDHKKSFNERIEFNNDIKPGQSFKAKLRLNENSLVEDGLYSWTIDVVAQLAMTTKFIINYDFMIGYEYKVLRKVANGMAPKDEKSRMITVRKQTTKDLWDAPPKRPHEPVHLIILTHGIFSNLGADMLYIKEQIEKKANSIESSNILVRGYDGNVGKSEKGVRFLGKRVAKYILDLCDHSPYHIDRISFVGHSLGGPVQAYAISQIVAVRPYFFNSIIPVNFIGLAGPFLGILSDFPIAVSWALDVGALGRTGRDLTLSYRFPSIMKNFRRDDDSDEPDTDRKFSTKPILEVIPSGAAHEVFEKFKNRTVYANAVNDGIVPLRTSALLYLDWRGLGDLSALKKKYEELAMEEDGAQNGQRARKGSVGEIPKDSTTHGGDVDNNVNSTRTNSHQKENLTEAQEDGRDSHQIARLQDKNQNKHNVSDTKLKDQASNVLPRINTEKQQANKSNKGRITELQSEDQEKEQESDSSSGPDSPSILRPPTLVFKSKQKKSRRKKLKKYIRTQTKSGPNEEKDWEDMKDGEQADDEIEEYNIPPAASTFLSAANVMLSPLPEQEYLMHPEKRLPNIFHDKKYTFDDLPPAHFSKKLKNAKSFKHFIKRDKNVIEEKIAREWHWKMEWRKVLVTLKPDAHNNIVVRRKFSNAFGWSVVDHLVDNHFGEEAVTKETQHVYDARETESRNFNSNIEDFA